MKKFILSALAATLVASPLLAAAPAEAQQRREVTTVRHNDNNGRTVVTKRTVVRTPQYRNWRAGQRFDRRQAQNYRVITTYRNYRLAAAAWQPVGPLGQRRVADQRSRQRGPGSWRRVPVTPQPRHPDASQDPGLRDAALLGSGS